MKGYFMKVNWFESEACEENYLNVCPICKTVFAGPKEKLLCKKCENKNWENQYIEDFKNVL